MILCVDIGNTMTKIASFENGVMTNKHIVATNKNTQVGAYSAILAKFDKPEKVVLSSVVPEVSDIIIQDINSAYQKSVMRIGPGVKTGIKIKVAHPKEVGNDIVAQVVGARKLIEGDVLVVALGTASTFTFLSKTNELVGTSFMPGINLSRKALSVGTSKLMSVEIKNHDKILGNDTETAIQTGIIYSQVGAIELIYNKLKAKYKDLGLVITGGYLNIIREHVSIDAIYQDELCLLGLNEIGDLNE